MPRSDERSTPKGWSRGNTKIGPVLEVKVTYHLYQHGIEIKVDSMKNGSQSWIVICRRLNKYVNELLEENKKSIHYEELVTSTGRDPLGHNRRNNQLHHYLRAQRWLCRSINDGCA